MSVSTYVSARSSRIADTVNAFLVAARWTLVLTAIAITMVLLVKAGILPWTLSEVDPTLFAM